MIRLINSILVGVLVVLNSSCSKRPVLAVEEFKEFLITNRNLLINRETISGVDYHVSLDPPELLAFRNNIGAELSNKVINEEVSKYGNSVYCSLVIKDSKNFNKVKQLVGSQSDYFKLVGVANTSLQSNFKLVIDGETLLCKVCHMEAPSSINPELRIVFAFDYDPKKLYGESSKGCEVIFEDDIFNNGILKFSFDKSDLCEWPELRT